MKELRRDEFAPIHLAPGDSIIAKVKDDLTGEIISETEHHFTEATTLDTAVIFETDKLFGLKNVIGAVFGKD